MRRSCSVRPANRQPDADLIRRSLELAPIPVLLVGGDRQILYRNAEAARRVSTRAATCCDAVCTDHCLTRSLLREQGDVQFGAAQAPFGSARVVRMPGAQVVAFYLESTPAEPSPEGAQPPLRIDVLGPTRIQIGDRSLVGEWLAHRPGQVLKYLVVARGRVVSVDELVDALWFGTRPAAATASVRQAVHNLRARLEPDRRRGSAAGYITSHRGAYSLRMDRVQLDVDAFERLAAAGLAASMSDDPEHAENMLSVAIEHYRGDLLQEDPYAEWVLQERDRMRSVAIQVLRVLARLQMERDGLEAAHASLERLATIEPLDVATQRELLAILVRSGRHSEAARRYQLVRRRHLKAFGEEPGFALSDVASDS